MTDPTTLREHLTRLHEELSHVQRVGSDTNPLLGKLMDEIKRLMDAPPAVPAWVAGAAAAPEAAPPAAGTGPAWVAGGAAPGPAAEPVPGAAPMPGTAAAPGSAPALGAAPGLAPDDPLPDRLEKLAVQFEADHPTLAASSRRLIDLLGKVGV